MLGVKATLDFYQTIAVDQLQLPGIVAVATGVGSPFLNVVLDVRDKKANNKTVIPVLRDFFHAHQVPWSWLVMANAVDPNLTADGLVLLEQAPSMYVDLTQPLPVMQRADIRIAEMGKDDDLSGWIQPLQEGFPATESQTKQDIYQQLNARLLHQGESKLRHFVVYEQETVAAVGTLFISGDTVMLHNLATKKQFQRLGIASALIMHLMAEAKQLGMKHCFLDTSTDTVKLYQKLGFTVYCHTQFFVEA